MLDGMVKIAKLMKEYNIEIHQMSFSPHGENQRFGIEFSDGENVLTVIDDVVSGDDVIDGIEKIIAEARRDG